MSYLPEIIVSEGELREGETIELRVDFSGDALFFKHPHKHWTVFAEKNIKVDVYTGDYYYEENEGTLYTATDANNIQVKYLIPGRLFAIFEYTTIFGEEKTVIKVFRVYPKITITKPDEIIQNTDANFVATSTLNDVSAIWSFTDGVSGISGMDIQKDSTIDGYFTAITELDYSNALFHTGEKVAWETSPTDKLAYVSLGLVGNGTPCNPSTGVSISGANVYYSFTESISTNYLVKYDLDQVINVDLVVSNSVDNIATAPLYSTIYDNSTYSIEVATSGSDRIDYIEIDYGDGVIRRYEETNFEDRKLYERSGTFSGSYTVHTSHTRTGGDDYTQTKVQEFSLTVDPFFTKWFIDHFPSNLYNSDGFLDLAQGWGLQMDRLYNETQIFMESIDSQKINNIFIEHLAANYGDFPEIYQKVGFEGFTDDVDDRFDYFTSYNFFDRIAQGVLKVKEKQEFITYIEDTQRRLLQKGTPISIERAVAQFCLIAQVRELWATSFKPKTFVPVKDEIFGGDDVPNNTGLSYQAISTPNSDNLNQVIVNSNSTSFIEINTANTNNMSYYTDSSTTVIRNGKQYLVIELE